MKTLESVAKKAGCSVSTVSRVVNGNAAKYRISDRTAVKVMEVAKQMNFTPNLLGKALRTNKSDSIALIVPNIENAFFSEIAGVIIREARNYNYKVIVADTQENEEFEKEAVSSLLARRVDGILIIPIGKDDSYIPYITKNKLPIVQIDRYLQNSDNLSYVSCDNYSGGQMAIEHLIKNGHRNIVCIQGSPSSLPANERTRAYVDTLEKYGLGAYKKIRGNNFSIQNGYIEMKLLLSCSQPPTAIFAQSNLILLGAIKAVLESNLHIPDDISVISFDDNILFNYLNPAITCVAQPIKEISLLATKILMEEIKEQVHEVSHIFLQPKLIIRNSVKNIFK